MIRVLLVEPKILDTFGKIEQVLENVSTDRILIYGLMEELWFLTKGTKDGRKKRSLVKEEGQMYLTS